MYAIHQTLLPSSAINFTLFLPHFTPSTIYPIPQPSSSRVQLQDVQVAGNLVVAGGSDLRVFEVRESKVPVDNDASEVKDEVGDSYLNTAPKRAPLTYTTKRSLHLVASYQLHGTITGLAPLRTVESAVDGLDRLLVSFKDAKMAILEWLGGDIATVSLHTYERAIQMTTGDMTVYEPILRSDPLSRLALLTLPDDSLAVLPLSQDQSELDPLDAYPRDLPYSPSYVLSLAEQFTIKNLRDLAFLPGFNTPTLAMLFSPHQTWAGRYGALRDTFQLEIRTFDVAAGYPLLTSVRGLPADCLYMITAPTDIGGVVIVTETGIIHVDQAGRIAASSVSGWWRHVTMLRADGRNEYMKLSLQGSKAVFVEREMVLVLADGSAHQVKLEMDGRAVGAIIVQERMAVLPPPAGISVLKHALFVGCAEGDSVLYDVDMVRDEVKGEEVKPYIDMDADDDDLYADANPILANGHGPSGPARVQLETGDTLSGIGKIIDMEFGIAATDQGLRTYPQLVAISGGTRQSTFNVFRRGIPINKRRRFNELSTAERVWFLPIQRAAGQRLRDISDEERSTLLLSSEGSQTRVFALSNKANPEQIGRLPIQTITAAPFFLRTMVMHVHAMGVSLLDANGKPAQEIYAVQNDDRIASASICDPYLAIRLTSGEWVLFEGDDESKTVKQKVISEPSHIQAVEVFTDTTGIYRTFDPATHTSADANDIYASSTPPTSNPSSIPSITNTKKPSNIATTQQIQTLLSSEPRTSSSVPSADAALHTGRGSLWLATLSQDGALIIRSLPGGEVVFESERGLEDSLASFEDDVASGGNAGIVSAGLGGQAQNGNVSAVKAAKRGKGKGKGVVKVETGEDVDMGTVNGHAQNGVDEEEDEEDEMEVDEMDEVEQMLFHTLGKWEHVRPHLFVLHKSGRLNIYASLPRFTLSPSPSSPAGHNARRALAVRFKKVHTQLLPTSSSAGSTTVNAHGPGSGKLPYTMHPFDNLEGLTGVFITGEKPQWIIGDEKYDVRSYALKQAAYTFGRTTHLGGKGEYFIRIEDGTFICYLPANLNTDFAMPCDRYEMDRVYTNLAFDPPSAHYVGAAALTVPFQAYDEEGEILLGPEGETLNPATNERSSLELFSQGEDPWRVIDGYDFDQNEVVLALESVKLESDSMPGGFRDFVAVGTGFDFAEDRATRGNTYIFEVVQTVPADPSNPKTSGWRLKLRTKDPARNPVSAIANMNGYLLNSNGPKMYAKGLDRDERLMGLAFLDINLYATSLKTFKNFALVGDLTKSMWLISFQEHPYKLLAISKDLQEVHTVSADFLVHDGQVSFLSTDRFGNMRMLEFDPADPDSYNGERLMLRTEYHMGAPVTTCKTVARRRAPEEEFAPQTQLIYATADGALTTVVSVKPARFKRLQLVAEQLTRNARHVAGMNPKAFRTVRNDLLSKPLNKGILDGQLLNHFALQPVHRQREMMRQIGTDEVTVASDLQALGGFW